MSSFFSFNIYSTIWSCKLVHVQKSALCLETSCSTRALNILLFLLCILILIITTLFCDLFFCERNTQRLNKSNRKSKSFIRSYRKSPRFHKELILKIIYAFRCSLSFCKYSCLIFSDFSEMGRNNRTRKFAEMKRMIKARDGRLNPGKNQHIILLIILF